MALEIAVLSPRCPIAKRPPCVSPARTVAVGLSGSWSPRAFLCLWALSPSHVRIPPLAPAGPHADHWELTLAKVLFRAARGCA